MVPADALPLSHEELQKAARRELAEARDSRSERLLQEEIEDLRQDRELRQEYSSKLFTLVVVWLGLLWLAVFAHGLPVTRFRLDPDVLRLLVASTTASVIGLFAIVANYLFPRR